MTQTVLRIDASARRQGSVTRDLATRIVAALPDARVIHRDLAESPVPQITEAWVAANFTPEADRTAAQRAALGESDALVAELRAADTVVIGLPVYNFGVPAALKAWIDQVARAGVTFRYTAEGPEGLLAGKRAIVAMASGGTPVGAPIDHATGYLRHILGFMGIEDVSFVAADALMVDEAAAMARAGARIDELAA
ncbi:FMN-dependent NADH-azoreductase [Roseovarius salinarum]|uniref:FMN-dependent NADH-azoreductase n=1 Tax=Roseovarius salinarum TaxID=1981892 RepID=UPI000C32C20D|nr:NAD(P)H-dependent oxidoreductase [Roseovarius salinarum]